MPSQITTGVKITVDASDISNKFTKSVDELNATLSKNQKALGLVYNEQGILTNALGQTVEGLSQSAIKLGQYVDELGRVRTYQDGFIDGLTRTQIELGFYTDEIGNIYNKLGELVGMTDKARRAQEQEAAAAENAAQAQADAAVALQDGLSRSADAVAQVAGQFAIFQQLLQKSGATSEEFGASVANIANAVSVAAGSFKASSELIKTFSEVAKLLPPQLIATATASKAAAPALAAVGVEAKAAGAAIAGIGGPVTLAISAITALVAGLAALSASKVETDALSESFKDLQTKAERAGTSIRSLADALKVGAFATAETEIEAASRRFLDAKANLDKARADLDAYKKEADAYNESRKYATGANIGGGPNIKDFGDAAKFGEFNTEWKNAIAEYNAVAAKYVDAARAAQQTEEQKLKEQRDAYAALLKVAEKMGDDKTANLFKAQIDLLDGQILDARKKQAAEAKKQKEQEENAAKAEREKQLASAGVLEYIKKQNDAQKQAAVSLDNYAATVAKWREMAKNGQLTSKELSDAEQGLAATLREKLGAELGIQIDATKKTATAYEKLAKALEDGVITQEQADAAKKALAEKERAELAARLGVTFTAPSGGDSGSATVNDYAAKVKALDDALQQGIITQQDYNAATAQLRDAARGSISGLEATGGVADSYAKRVRELDAALKNGIIESKERDRLVNDAKTALAQSLGVSEEDIKAYEKRRAKAEADYERGLIDAAERDRRLNNASKKLEKARDDAAKKAAAEKDRQDTRSKLGIDQLLESMKSPVQKYKETLDQIADALKKNAVNANEAEALRQQAAETYLKTLNADAEQLGQAGGAQSQKGAEFARSMSSGSEDLYLAQVRNTTNSYQNSMTQAAQQLQNTTAAMLQTSNRSLEYLQMLVDSQGDGVAVWG